MDLFSLVIGIAVGSAFSSFWLDLWTKIKPKLLEIFSKKSDK
jgi:hypothetical protein